MSHSLDIRIYYEDTDAGGIVYYANYLKFMERARTELLREKGFLSSESLSSGAGFVVANLAIKYKASAKLDDLLTVRTTVKDRKNASLVLQQDIYKAAQLLTESEITLAYVDLNGRPVKLPHNII
jgi:tol-pal system-associated acyl-CoA thioesterase